MLGFPCLPSDLGFAILYMVKTSVNMEQLTRQDGLTPVGELLQEYSREFRQCSRKCTRKGFGSGFTWSVFTCSVFQGSFSSLIRRASRGPYGLRTEAHQQLSKQRRCKKQQITFPIPIFCWMSGSVYSRVQTFPMRPVCSRTPGAQNPPDSAIGNSLWQVLA